jgi:hypothetical protein
MEARERRPGSITIQIRLMRPILSESAPREAEIFTAFA